MFYPSPIRTESPCKTPDNLNGDCIALQQCRPLYKLVRINITTEQRTLLRSSQCGRNGDTILVCCPNTFTVNDLPSTQYCGKQVGNKLAGGPETSIYEFPWYELIGIISNQSVHLFNLISGNLFFSLPYDDLACDI